MQALIPILIVAFVLGIAYVRTNMFRSSRRRSSVLQNNIALQAIHLLAGLLLVVAFVLCGLSGHMLRSIAGGLIGVAYDLALRQLCLYREIRRLIAKHPGVEAGPAKHHVLRRAELAYQAPSRRRANNVGLSTTVNLRVPVKRSATPAKPQPRPAAPVPVEP